jgi:protein Tex
MPASQLAAEIRVSTHQVQTAVELLDGGATVPFIARYRKEATGGLDDIQLRELEARLAYLRELQDRLKTVVKAIDEQGKLTPVLLAALQAASSKQALEDLYLPFKLKRRTKGQLAMEAGLLPLADALLADPQQVPADAAQPFLVPFKPAAPGEDIVPDFSTVPAVLDGVRDILSERWAQDPAVVAPLREWLWEQGLLQSRRVDSQPEANAEVAKFRDYFDYDEPIGRVPSHRALAVFRGRALGFLDAKLVLPASNTAPAFANVAQEATKTVANAAAAKGPEVTLAEAEVAAPEPPSGRLAPQMCGLDLACQIEPVH